MCTPHKAENDSKLVIETYGDFYQTFITRYNDEFGFTLKGRKTIVDDIRVRGSGKNVTPTEKTINLAESSPTPEKVIYFILKNKLIY